MKGFAPLQREFFAPNQYWTSEPFTRPQAFVDLLILAGFRERTVFIGNHEIALNAGELAFSERFLARRWKRSRGFVQKALKDLCTKGMIAIDHRNCITVIRILERGKYQHLPEKPVLDKSECNNGENPVKSAAEKPLRNPPSDEAQKPENGPVSKLLSPSNPVSVEDGSQFGSRTNPPERSQIEECIYDLKKKKDTRPEVSVLAEFLFSEILKNDPYFRKPPGANWAAELERLQQDKGIPHFTLMRIIELSQSHTFWKKHINSPSSLRKHFHAMFMELQEAGRKNRQNQLLPASQRSCYEIN